NPSLVIRLSSSLRDYAGFANVTYALTPRFDITAGVRVEHNDQRYQQFDSGSSLAGLNSFLASVGLQGLPPIAPHGTSKETIATYLASVRYKIADNMILYARAANGYRPGGPNATVPGL